MRRAIVALLVASATIVPARAHPLPRTPFTQDPLGPLVDVTASADRYQPATVFCVKPDVFQLTGVGVTVTGADRACARSGFAKTARGLVKIRVRTPALCNGCRRLFLDYRKIPATDAPPNFYAHGHAYFHFGSLNPSYTVDPEAHSPNVKNFTNDKLFVPDGSPQESLVWAFDLHARAYTGNTVHTIHSDPQGPYYAGPWYLNRAGRRIIGAYLDVTVVTDLGALPGDHRLNEIGYFAGFHSGEPTCVDEVAGGGRYADGDALYGGCVDHFGAGSQIVDPFGRSAVASSNGPLGSTAR